MQITLELNQPVWVVSQHENRVFVYAGKYLGVVDHADLVVAVRIDGKEIVEVISMDAVFEDEKEAYIKCNNLQNILMQQNEAERKRLVSDYETLKDGLEQRRQIDIVLEAKIQQLQRWACKRWYKSLDKFND